MESQKIRLREKAALLKQISRLKFYILVTDTGIISRGDIDKMSAAEAIAGLAILRDTVADAIKEMEEQAGLVRKSKRKGGKK